MFKTDSDGFIYFDEIHKVSGSSFFLDSFGTPSIPIGTITVQETKAPAGYVINNEIYTVHFTLREDGTVRSDRGTWNTAAGLEDLSVVSEEKAVYGGVRFRKTDSATGSSVSSVGTSLAGAVITIYNNSGKEIVLRDGTRAADGAPVMTVRTSADGIAQTASDALPFGTYYAKETGAPEGYVINSAWRSDFSISADGTVTEASTVLADAGISGTLRLTKTDAVTGTPQGDASLAGIRFAVVNDSDRTLRVGSVEVRRGAVASIITTDEDGTASTASGELPYGSYTVYELRSDASISAGEIYRGSSKLGSSALANDKGYRFGTSSRGFSIDTDGQTISVSFSDDVVSGVPKIIKRDSENGSAQGDSSLSGIRFAVVNSSAKPVKVGSAIVPAGRVAAVLTTGEDGTAKGPAVPYGTYTVYELREDASIAAGDVYSGSTGLGKSIYANGRGILFRAQSRTLTVRKQDAEASVTFEDSAVRGGISVTKTAEGGPRGDVSLSGVRFAVVNKSSAPVIVGGKKVAAGSVAAVLTTGEDGMAATDPDALPFGAYTVYELRSDSPISEGAPYDSPSGFGSSVLANGGGLLYRDQSADVIVSENGRVVNAEFTDSIVLGGVSVTKKDQDLGKNVPQGDASLAGIVFEIVNRSEKPVDIDGKEYAPGAVVMTVTTDEEGRASTGAVLPFGTYEIREKESNGSYELTDTAPRTFKIRENGVTVDAGGKNGFRNEVVKGGAAFRKVDGITRTPLPFGHGSLAGAEITIYNDSVRSVTVDGIEYAPGEAVLTLTTDEEGRCSTAADALPYGTYYALETRASEGYLINRNWKAVFSIRSSGVIPDTAEGHVLTEERIPVEIRTSARDRDSGGRTGASAGKETVGIVDTVVMRGLIPGKTYSLTAVLVDREASTEQSPVPIGGPVVKTFTVPNDAAAGDDHTVDVEMEVASEEIAGRTAVVFETLSFEGTELAVHADIDDQEQTVGYPLPTIRTEAADGYTGDREGTANAALVTIVDEVTLTGLASGREYVLEGRLADREKSTRVRPVYIGEPASKTFYLPDDVGPSDEYSVSLEITVPQELISGKSAVVFETLYSDGRPIASHEDPDDEAQTVAYAPPGMSTFAVDKAVGDKDAVAVGETVTVVDTVTMTGLRAGTEYTLVSRAVDKYAGEGKDGVLGGSEVTFTTPAGSGSEEYRMNAEIVIPADKVIGKSVVCFEVLYQDGSEIAVHADPGDEDQTVRYGVPGIRTTAVDMYSGGHAGYSDGVSVSIVDTVLITGIKGGKEYTLTGKLIDKDASVEEGAVYIEGSEQSVIFGTEEGETEKIVEMVFSVDADMVTGRRIVVSETLSLAGHVIAVHEDPEDEAQTVEYPVPRICTAAAGTDGGKMLVPDVEGRGVIVDTVSAVNFRPGTKVAAWGILIDAETGAPLEDEEGNCIVSESEETEIQSPEDTVEVLFVIDDLQRFAGKGIVVFERLYLAGTDKLLALHEDPGDEAQTVFVQLPPEIPDTGDGASPLFHAGMIAAAAAGIATVLLPRRRKAE